MGVDVPSRTLKEDHDPKKLLKTTGKRVEVRVYAACDAHEQANENAFTSLLKGQKPDSDTF